MSIDLVEGSVPTHYEYNVTYLFTMIGQERQPSPLLSFSFIPSKY